MKYQFNSCKKPHGKVFGLFSTILGRRNAISLAHGNFWDVTQKRETHLRLYG
jgi:hypothetical protein